MKADLFRSELLRDSPMHYAPENELGVVFLFSKICPKLQMRIDRIQAGFPDCIAYQRVGGREKRIRIEFEFKSRNFAAHKHDARKCDWIVCWEHNWPSVPSRLHVLELRKLLGHGLKVWLINVPAINPDGPPSLKERSEEQWGRIIEEMQIMPIFGNGEIKKKIWWRFKSRASVGDLVLMHHFHPSRWIEHIYQVTKDDFRNVCNRRYLVELKLVASLKPPLHRDAIEKEPLFRDNRWDRGESNRNITEYWWALYQMIIRQDPTAESWLERYSPEKI